MARTDRKGDTEQAALEHRFIDADRLYPNPWNVNEMDEFMFAKELESIRQFGFVDPLLVRPHPYEHESFQIIDGEHRWRAGKELGMTVFPVNVIEADDETAQQLSIVLNETRGRPNEVKLSSLVRSLLEKRGEQVARALPFTSERLAQMVAEKEEKIDFFSLQQRQEILQRHRDTSWVERVYRLPKESAAVVDQALQKVMSDEGLPPDQDWKALELIAADSLAGP
jgi:ParB/RepB/Spo0J family partition protein